MGRTRERSGHQDKPARWASRPFSSSTSFEAENSVRVAERVEAFRPIRYITCAV